jgi:hypothetical protein
VRVDPLNAFDPPLDGEAPALIRALRPPLALAPGASASPAAPWDQPARSQVSHLSEEPGLQTGSAFQFPVGDGQMLTKTTRTSFGGHLEIDGPRLPDSLTSGAVPVQARAQLEREILASGAHLEQMPTARSTDPLITQQVSGWWSRPLSRSDTPPALDTETPGVPRRSDSQGRPASAFRRFNVSSRDGDVLVASVGFADAGNHPLACLPM